ncbi:hypothetical protein CANINC_000312 [Pichia inconspicua]|uniref:Uncharacterized protein n=1 Tax=Pichia inconspicua TaxID=52247 RepID=A0A4T0X6F3_9ASCO|nr:hypothetical protein CANINC_000312 [[Candida] inconspicua]
MGKQILVTTGATVTFVPLIRAVISKQFVEEVCALGYTDLVVQYAGDTTSVHLVEELLSQLQFASDNDTGESANVFKGTLVKGKLRIVAL